MSYSLQEPEWPQVCECMYDEIQDRMDRGNCCLHCDLEDSLGQADGLPAERKPPTSVDGVTRRRKSAFETTDRRFGQT